jgi:hypothetical protein
MNGNQHSNLKNKLPKWLFAVALLLSLFTFPGLPYQLQAKYEVPKTTLLFSIHREGPGKSITYNRVLAKSKLLSHPLPTTSSFELSRVHTLLVKTQISTLSEWGILLKRSIFFYQPKTIFSNTDGEPAILLG